MSEKKQKDEDTEVRNTRQERETRTAQCTLQSSQSLPRRRFGCLGAFRKRRRQCDAPRCSSVDVSDSEDWVRWFPTKQWRGVRHYHNEDARKRQAAAYLHSVAGRRRQKVPDLGPHERGIRVFIHAVGSFLWGFCHCRTFTSLFLSKWHPFQWQQSFSTVEINRSDNPYGL
jgi:hypothetical protein